MLPLGPPGLALLPLFPESKPPPVAFVPKPSGELSAPVLLRPVGPLQRFPSGA
jgi:hypothetical protein